MYFIIFFQDQFYQTWNVMSALVVWRHWNDYMISSPVINLVASHLGTARVVEFNMMCLWLSQLSTSMIYEKGWESHIFGKVMFNWLLFKVSFEWSISRIIQIKAAPVLTWIQSLLYLYCQLFVSAITRSLPA